MNLLIAAALMGGLGVTCLLRRSTLLGMLLGTQLLGLGASLSFVSAGVHVGAQLNGGIFTLFVLLSFVVVLTAGAALTIRLYYLARSSRVAEIRRMSQ